MAKSGCEDGACERLMRAVRASLGELRLDATTLERRSRPWASATFSGARHSLLLGFGSAQCAEHAARALPESEFDLPGHLVADLTATASGARVSVEALTIETA